MTELVELTTIGFSKNSVHYKVEVGAFICDAPARSFLKCIILHTGYNSCERCTIKGEYRKNRIVFNSFEEFPLRTDLQFHNLDYYDPLPTTKCHQKGKSPLIDANIDCISKFVLDYMHFCCLGVMKRILKFLKSGPRICKLSDALTKQISQRLQLLNGKFPQKFSRQARALDELDRWKATEFRQFLLYSGVICLEGIVNSNLYEHFLLLSIGIRILLDSNEQFRNYYVEYSRNLLTYFVQTAEVHYGEEFTVYNVHNLIHLPDDVIKHGNSLNEISAFPFENHMKCIKRLVKSGRNPLVQVAKKQGELDAVIMQKSYKISKKLKDSCFILKEDKYVFVQNITAEGNYDCLLLKKIYFHSLFNDPVDSKDFGIGYFLKFDDKFFVKTICRKSQFLRQGVVLPFKNGFALFPMIHDREI